MSESQILTGGFLGASGEPSGPWEIVSESVDHGPDFGPGPDHNNDVRNLRLPPQNVQAEMCCLGGCLLSNNALDEVLGILKPEHFYVDAHRLVYAALQGMRNAGRSDIDVVTVAEWMESHGTLKDAGSVLTLTDCMETVPHAAHSAYYAEMVRDCARRRGLELAAMNIMRATPRKDIPTDEMLATAESAIHAVMEDGISDEPQSLGDILIEAVAAIENGQPTQKTVPIGWPHMDNLTGGMPCGAIIVVAGRTSQGKSAVAMSLAMQIAERGDPVLFSSYEQPFLELGERAWSLHSGVEFRRMRSGHITEQERQRVMVSAGIIQTWPIYFDAKCRRFSQLATMIRLMVRRKGIKLAIVDYVQLIPTEDPRLIREQQVAQISRGLKVLAMQVGIPIMVLAQLNRDVEKRDSKRPKLSDLRESGSLEQDADHVWFIYRPNYYGPQEDNSDGGFDDHGILYVAKQRNGPPGDVRLAWNAGCMKYDDVSPDFVGPGPTFASDDQTGSLF